VGKEKRARLVPNLPGGVGDHAADGVARLGGALELGVDGYGGLAEHVHQELKKAKGGIWFLRY
jgi:hypothetical protein